MDSTHGEGGEEQVTGGGGGIRLRKHAPQSDGLPHHACHCSRVWADDMHNRLTMAGVALASEEVSLKVPLLIIRDAMTLQVMTHTHMHACMRMQAHRRVGKRR